MSGYKLQGTSSEGLSEPFLFRCPPVWQSQCNLSMKKKKIKIKTDNADNNR